MILKKCVICGSEFETKTHNKKYCSTDCQKEARKIKYYERKERKKREEKEKEDQYIKQLQFYKKNTNKFLKICPLCHQKFKTINPIKKYCTSCNMEHQQQQKNNIKLQKERKKRKEYKNLLNKFEKRKIII